MATAVQPTVAVAAASIVRRASVRRDEEQIHRPVRTRLVNGGDLAVVGVQDLTGYERRGLGEGDAVGEVADLARMR